MKTLAALPTLPPSRSLGALALVLLASAARAQEGEIDKVYLRDFNVEQGKILEENFAGLTLQPDKGAKKTIAWDQIQSTEYFDAPPELANGLATLRAGDPAGALELLSTALTTEGLRPLVAQQAAFLMAVAEQRMGKPKEALAHYEKLLSEYPKTRYLRMIGENLIVLHLKLDDANGAKAALDKLAQGAKGTDGLEPLTQLLDGRWLEAQGKLAEAKERYAAVEGAAGSIAQEGKLGRARVMLRDGKAGEAEPILRDLIQNGTSSRVQSGAWNGIGEIQSAEGKAKKDGERILEGLYAYLRTVVQYKPLPGEDTEEYERALFGASNCFDLLSQLEQNPEKKKLLRDRQRERIEQLQQEFPNSSFLKK
jgi:tetratricopeptide (TPR) repeat protein